MTNKITFLARLFSVLSATFLAVSCESDDICDHTVNTPRLVVRFYNANNTRTPMSIANLTIYGEGNSTPLVSNATLDSIALPLRLQNPTTYLTLTYNTEETFVSKACGIKTTYNTLSATIQDANTSWLKGVTIKNNTIDNEKKAHIHLYH